MFIVLPLTALAASLAFGGTLHASPIPDGTLARVVHIPKAAVWDVRVIREDGSFTSQQIRIELAGVHPPAHAQYLHDVQRMVHSRLVVLTGCKDSASGAPWRCNVSLDLERKGVAPIPASHFLAVLAGTF